MIFVILFFVQVTLTQSFDVTLVGLFGSTNGLSKIALNLAEELSNDLTINIVVPNANSDQPLHLANGKVILHNGRVNPGKVAFLTYLPTLYEHVPESYIKIAYSMFESTKIPTNWVKSLNKVFDLVCVPDDYLVNVYKTSGVRIPIFVLPCPLRLRNFLNQKKCTTNNAFIFRMSAGLFTRKNQTLLINAFNQEFRGNPEVKLLLHVHKDYSYAPYREEVLQLLAEIKNPNISLIEQTLHETEYIHFMSSLHCYVFLSKGEGFSMTPREAMALGVPCILANNTAQKTLCASGYAYAVKSEMKEQADYAYCFPLEDYGYQFNCSLNDARRALREVYSHYSYYESLAIKGKKWAAHHDFAYNKQRYISLFKPKRVVFGSSNVVMDDYIETNSKTLYKKYKKLICSI